MSSGSPERRQLAAAHAHLNLIGGVLLFLFGLYYRPVPAAGTTSLARVQGWLHMIGAILFPAGVAVVRLKGEAFVAAPIVGSLIVVAATALFTVVVFRTSRACPCLFPRQPLPPFRRHLLSPSMA